MVFAHIKSLEYEIFQHNVKKVKSNSNTVQHCTESTVFRLWIIDTNKKNKHTGF